MTKIGVIGSGSWATALVKCLEINKQDYLWWIRDHRIISFVKRYHRNPYYLRATELSAGETQMSSHLEEVISKSDIVLLAIPSLYLYQNLQNLPRNIFAGKKVVSAIKGLIPETHQCVSEYLHFDFNLSPDDFLFLTGPSHAEEVVRRQLTFMSLASPSRESYDRIAPVFENHFFKFRYSKHVQALEYSAVLKNIYAIASGLAHGLGYGDNFLAVLVSNAIRETNNFIKKGCCGPINIMASGFLGDLLVTSYSQLSRNRTFGTFIGRGYSPKAALLEMNMIPEGYYASKAFQQIMIKKKTQMPIAKTVYKILYKKLDPKEGFARLEKRLK